MRHDEHGLAGIGEFEHHVKHFAHHFRIERGGDFVEQQYFRMQNQRTADGHALALAAGKLMRPGILAVGKTDAFQKLDRLLLDFGLISLLHQGRRQCDVAKHGFVGKQVVALEHHANTGTQFAAALAAAGGFGARLTRFDHFAVQRNGTALNRLKAGDGAQQRRLAGAGRPDDHKHLAMRHVERNIVQYRLVGIGVLFDQMRNLKTRLTHLSLLACRVSHATTSFPVGGPRWTAASTQ